MAKAAKTIIGKEIDDELFTPQWLLDWLPPIDFDPFWSPHSNVRPQKYYVDVREHGSSLDMDWALPSVEHIFNNFPYSNSQECIHKCVEASRHHGILVTMLLQAKPGERAWWQDIWPSPTTFSVGFLKGRMKFDRPPAPEPPEEEKLLAAWRKVTGLDPEKWLPGTPIKSIAGTFNSALVLMGDKDLCAAAEQQIRQQAVGHKHEPFWVMRKP